MSGWRETEREIRGALARNSMFQVLANARRWLEAALEELDKRPEWPIEPELPAAVLKAMIDEAQSYLDLEGIEPGRLVTRIHQLTIRKEGGR